MSGIPRHSSVEGMAYNNGMKEKAPAPAAGGKDFARFDLGAIAASFPPSADTLLIDTYLTYETAASARVFRVYKETPPHYHATCDEYLYVLAGRGMFWMGSPENGGEFAPGHLLFFKRGTVHAFPQILEWPVVFFSVDTPRRDPRDVIFVDSADGTPDTFIRARQT
jgi:mannose-6-phosphate isomerase-like protein (cupin superfamily)